MSSSGVRSLNYSSKDDTDYATLDQLEVCKAALESLRTLLSQQTLQQTELTMFHRLSYHSHSGVTSSQGLSRS